MFVNIVPVTVSQVGTKVFVQIPQFELGATEGEAQAHVSTETGFFIRSERVPIPPEVYAEWGQDDRFIVDYVMEQLGLVEAPHIIEPVE